jgi:hypothetical protein
MTTGWMRAAIIAACLVQPLAVFAAEPIKRIGLHVQPYYEASRTGDGEPHVAVGKTFDPLLASNKREDIVAARDLIVAKPEVVTPMTMMVLAIRFYDVGLRDDSVFWFYAAKDRFITLSDVLDVKAAGLGQAEEAVKSFATLAGPVINGYAFCDLAKQQAARRKATDWVEQNPYRVLFMDRFAAKPGDRTANLKRSIASIRESAAKERAYFDDPKTVERYYAERKKNEADVKYCW